MKEVIRRTGAVFMAFMVMFSTMSFAVNKHYCMDHLVDVSLILPADSCGMDMELTPVSDSESISASSCCSEESIAIEGQKEVKTSSDWQKIQPEFFAAVFTYTYLSLFEEEAAEKTTLRPYVPPLIIKDLPVLYESYLI